MKRKHAVANIPTRYAIVKRMEKMVADIDQIYTDGMKWGLSYKEIDPQNQLLNIRKGLIKTLIKEGRIKPTDGALEAE